MAGAIALVVLAVVGDLPIYSDLTPPAPYVSVNSTWNTSNFASNLQRPFPTGQWWTAFADPTGTVDPVINALPLLVKRIECGFALAPPTLTFSNVNRAASHSFTDDVTVRVSTSATGCASSITGWDSYSVTMLQSVPQGLSAGDGIESIFARGSPFASFRAVGGTFAEITFKDRIRQVSNVQINGAVPVTASMLNITTEEGDAWLVLLPQKTQLTITRTSVVYTEAMDGWVRIAYIPTTGGSIAAASEYLVEHGSCVAQGGSPNTDIRGTTLTVEHKWNGAGNTCNPLMLTAPHHRTFWKDTWSTAWLSSPLQYETLMGVLMPAPARFTSFTLAHDVVAGFDDLTTRATNLQLCEEYFLHNKVLVDDAYLLGTVQTDSKNATGEDESLRVKSQELYGLAKTYRVARRLSAVKMGQRLQTRMFEVLSGMTSLAAYDSTWGGMVISPPDRPLSESITDQYENNTKIFGRILYGYAELYGTPPGSVKPAPTPPASISVFITALLRTVMFSGTSDWYPQLRNYDFYTALSFSGGLVADTEEGRVLSAPSDALIQWQAARDVSTLLGIANATQLATILFTMEAASVGEYWLALNSKVGTSSVAVATYGTMSLSSQDQLTTLSPVGEHLTSLRTEIALVGRTTQIMTNLLQTVPSTLQDTARPLETNTYDLTLLGIINGTHTLQLLENGVSVNYTVMEPLFSIVEYAVLSADPFALIPCSEMFSTWNGSLPLTVVGRQLWYKDSFNYQVRSIDYVPGVIYREPTQTNIYGSVYERIFKRDFPRIKDAGFNTLKVRWFSSKSVLGMTEFVNLAAEFDLNIIFTFSASEDEVLNNRHLTEQRFIDAMDAMADKSNVIMWNLESTSFVSISVDGAYNYLTLFRQLLRIRNKYDYYLRRPLALSLLPFYADALAVGGLNPVDIYTDGVEIVIMTVYELNLTSTRELLAKVAHPIHINLQSDSYHGINETQDAVYRSELLFNQTQMVLALHHEHEVCGVGVIEWVDEWWRGEDSDSDNDCSDPSPGRHSHCATRVIDFHDGEINLEHQGLHFQEDKWLLHCISPKPSYNAVSRALTGTSVDHGESCLFIPLDNFWAWFVMIASAAFFIAGIVLCTSMRVLASRKKRRAENKGAQSGTRWLQPDISKISRIIVKRTCTLPHTQTPFQRIAIQTESGLSSKDPAPLSGEWEGEVLWSELDQVRELGVFLQFSALPNNIGYTIQGQDVGNKYKITGQTRSLDVAQTSGMPRTKEDGSKLLVERYLVEFVAKNMIPDQDGGVDEDLEFVGVWEKWESLPNEDGATRISEVIAGGAAAAPTIPRGIQTGCRVIDHGEPFVEFAGSFKLSPQPEIDPWCYNRWQCVRLQLERLQMLIYDEMLCQGRWGTEAKYQETDAAFDYAVSTLHYRYMHSFYGWCHAQGQVGGILDIPDEAQEKRTDEQLTELLALFTLWQLGEQMTLFAGHWLSWNFHYFMKFKKFPPTHVINDGRHFMETNLTFDDLNESCALMPYYDVPHQCNEYCQEVCSIALEEKGQRAMPKLLLPDGNVDKNETMRYPFFKTFREPRKWGVVFYMLHDGFFILHTTILMFFFWALVVHFSDDNGSHALGEVMERSYNVWSGQPDSMRFIFLVLCKIDFWMVIIHESLDLWILSGITQSPALGVLGTRVCSMFGLMVCYCRCCCKRQRGATDIREISCQTFWTDTTCRRIRLRPFFQLRWSSYVALVSFAIFLGESLFENDATVSSIRITGHLLVRIGFLLIFNAVITLWPHRLHGSPVPADGTSRINHTALVISFFFWLLIYSGASVFMAWTMYRTENTGFSFCDCDGLQSDIEDHGATEFGRDLLSKVYSCVRDQPRCFTAVFFIWLSTCVMFAISVHGVFLLGVVFLGGVKHLLMQWQNKKSRNLRSHKMETKFILSAINVKLLSFSDPRDNKLAMRVWNRVIEVMHEEDLLTSYESETLQIHPHIVDIQFTLENAFAKERMSGFLEYLQSSTEFDETLGPVQCYPSVSVIVPVYGENVLADKRALRLKARGDHQQQSQLHFLVECYEDEWNNFIERCVNEQRLFRGALLEDQIVALLQDKQTLQEEFDYIKKRALKPDQRLREVCGKRVLELFHTRPKLFSDEEFDAVWWWASMRMQTVGRTIRGIERNREAMRFLLELESDYTQSATITPTYIDMMSSDKLQIVMALQRMSNSKWYDSNKEALAAAWRRFPKMQVVFDVETADYRMAPEVYQKSTYLMQDLWDCMEFASCVALWDVTTEDWYVNQVVGRRLPLRMTKSDQVKWSIPGPMQGKSVNQAHCLPFCKGQVIQTVDCNQDGYFEESLKMRSLLGKFFPREDRRWSEYKVVGHPEYVITMQSGTVGRYAGYAEYIFNTLFQRVLSTLGARMHYGHPDYFDASWVVTQGGLSKPNPRLNLNEDIFAGYHIKASKEHTIHMDDMKSGKGRETNFDGAMGFEQKLGMGAAMQYRSRDVFELSRYSNFLERHSIFFGSIGMYVYLGLVFSQIFTTMILHISLQLAGKTEYELSGTPYGSEWMLQVTLLEALPLGVQLILDYGVWGLFQWFWDFTGVTWFFLFVFLTKYQAFWGSVVQGNGTYVATGRVDPLYRRSFRHMWRLYSHSHFMYGSLLLALVVLFMDITSLSGWRAFIRSIFHWMVAFAWMVTPCLFNPSLTIRGLLKDIVRFFLWVWGDAIQKVKGTEDSHTLGEGQHNDRGGEKKKLGELFNTLVRKNRGDAEGDEAAQSGALVSKSQRDDAKTLTASPSTEFGDKDSFLGLPAAEEEQLEKDFGVNVLSEQSSEVVDDFGEMEIGDNKPIAASTEHSFSPRNLRGFEEFYDADAHRPTVGTRLKKFEDDDEGLRDSDELTMEHFIDRGVDPRTLDNLEDVFNKLDARNQYRGLIGPELIFLGFLSRGIRVKPSDVEEHLHALNVTEVTLEEFCLIYFMVEGTSAQLDNYGIDYAIENLPQEKYDSILKQQEEMKKYRQYDDPRDLQAESYIQFAYALRRSKAVREVQFYDSTHNLDRVRTESLLHHYKVALVLEHRGNSTTGRFLWCLATMGLWLFAYFALWQDILWEVFYFILIFAWEYVVCLPNVVPIVILTKVLVHVFVFVRLILMLGQTNVFFPTIFMTYWFVHSVIALKLSFWSAYGPYIMGRDAFRAKQIDQQRERALLMLLKDSREQYLFAFSYYVFCRRILAMIIVTFQFLFCILVLLVKAIIALISWLIWNVGKYFARRNATQTTYISSRGKAEEENKQRGRTSFDMMTQTDDGATGRGTHMWGEEMGTQIYLPGDDGFEDLMLVPPDMQYLPQLGFGLPDGFNPEDWPPEWLDLAFPDGKAASWLPVALNDDLPPAEWLKIAFGDDELPADWLDVCPPDELGWEWPEKPPKNWPERLSWPPPRPGKKQTDEIDPEWLKFLVAADDLDPEYIKKALKNDLPAAEWLKIAFGGDDFPAEWLDIAPPPGGLWPTEPPLNWPKDAPWPPPRPKAAKPGELDPHWIRKLMDPKNDDTLRKVLEQEDEPVDWLNLAAGNDPPADWLNFPGGGLPNKPPKLWPKRLPYPPPKGKDLPDDLPVDWLKFGLDKKVDDDKLIHIRDLDLQPVDWLKLAYDDDDLSPEILGFAPEPGKPWPEKPPPGYPSDAPWPPPRTFLDDDDDDVDVKWLKLAFDDDELTPEMLKAAVDGDLDPAEWLRIARGGDPNAEWLNMIPEPGKLWAKRPPKDYPKEMPWPPPKVPTNPTRRPVEGGEIPPEWLEIALNDGEDTLDRALRGELDPFDWLKLARGADPDPEWLTLGEDGEFPSKPPANYPAGLPWPPPKRKKENDVSAEWLAFAMEHPDLDDAGKQRALDGDLDTVEWLNLAAGGDPDPDWLKLDSDGEYKKERPKNYPANAPWPPPKPKSAPGADVPEAWLNIAMNSDAPIDVKRRAFEGDLLPAEWLKLATGDNLDPDWLSLGPDGEFPLERPDNYPVELPWPPPKNADFDLPIDWIRFAALHPTAPPALKKKAMNNDLDPVEWLALAAGEDPDADWLKLGPDGEYPTERPKNYPPNAPWPPPKVKARPDTDVPQEWINIAMNADAPLAVKKRAMYGQLLPTDWLRLSTGDMSPRNSWMSFGKDGSFAKQRPKDYPASAPWPPPKPRAGPLPNWLAFAVQNPDIPTDLKKRALDDELDVIDWLQIAAGDNPVDPDWLKLGPDREYPLARPQNYPPYAPWPPPKAKAAPGADVPEEWLNIAMNADATLDTKKRSLGADLLPAEWLKLATGNEPDPRWLALGPDGELPKTRPPGYPAHLPWPPPKRRGGDLPIDWIKFALAKPDLPEATRKRVLSTPGDIPSVEWLQIAAGNDPVDPAWLKLGPDGEFAKERPKNYPADAPWPPPKPKTKEAASIPPEWQMLLTDADCPPDAKRRGFDGDMLSAEWLQIATGDDPDPSWLSLGPDGNFPDERPATYPADKPWPPPPPPPVLKPRTKKRSTDYDLPAEWLQVALDKKVPDDTLRRAHRGDIKPQEWIRIALDGKDPPATWLSLGPDGKFPATRPEGYPKNLPWPPPDGKKGVADANLPAEWLKIAVDRGAYGMIDDAANDKLDPVEWLNLAMDGKQIDPKWLKLGPDGKYPKHPPVGYPKNVPWPPLYKRPDEDLDATMMNAPERPFDLPPEWLAMALEQNVPLETIERAKRGELSEVEWLRIANNGDEPPPLWMDKNVKGDWPAERPADYPADRPWPPPTNAKDYDLDPEWLAIAFERKATKAQIKRVIEGEMLPAEILELALGEDSINPSWLTVDQNGNYAESRPADYPPNLPWPPPKTKAATTAIAASEVPVDWASYTLGRKDTEKNMKDRALKGELRPIDWLKLVNGGETPPEEWLDLSGGRPPGYPPNAPWPPPSQKFNPNWEYKNKWIKFALARCGSKAVFTGMQNEMKPEDWLTLARGGQPPPKEWLQTNADGNFPEKPPEDYPKDMPWPPPQTTPALIPAKEKASPARRKKRAPTIGKKQQKAGVSFAPSGSAMNDEDAGVPTEWLNLAFHAQPPMDEDKLKLALKGELLPREWLQLAAGGGEIPAEWLKHMPNPGEAWPAQRPVGYPGDMPWPPPRTKKGDLSPPVSPSRNRAPPKSDQFLSAPGGGRDEENLPAVWLNFAFGKISQDTGGGQKELAASQLPDVINNDLPPAEWLKMANRGEEIPESWHAIIPAPGESWPQLAPEGYPIEAPWPPPKPKTYVSFYEI